MFAIVVATYFFLIAGFSIMTTLFALFTEKRFGYDARANGYLFGFIGILTVVVQGGLIGRLVKIFGEVTLARVGMLLTAASLAILPFSNHLPFLLLACAGLSFGSGFAKRESRTPPSGVPRSSVTLPVTRMSGLRRTLRLPPRSSIKEYGPSVAT